MPGVALLLWAFGTIALSLRTSGFTPRAQPWLPAGQIDRALAAVGAPLAVGDVLSRYMLALPAVAAVMLGLWRSAAALGPIASRRWRLPAAGDRRVRRLRRAGRPDRHGGTISAGLDAEQRLVLDTLGIPIEVLRSAAGW